MAGKKTGENSKKAAGNAKKAEAAAAKQAETDKKAAAAEDTKWQQGSKSTSKADVATAKKEEQARKKAEKDALLKEEEANLPSKKPGNAKSAQKKSRGLDLSGLDDPGLTKTLNPVNATGIDNALDALSLDSKNAGTEKIDRHPERRFKTAYAAYEEQRLEEMKDEKGLRRQQKIDQIRKEFDKHPDNPFNQVNADYNTTRAEMAEMREQEKAKTEARLTTA